MTLEFFDAVFLQIAPGILRDNTMDDELMYNPKIMIIKLFVLEIKLIVENVWTLNVCIKQSKSQSLISNE